MKKIEAIRTFKMLMKKFNYQDEYKTLSHRPDDQGEFQIFGHGCCVTFTTKLFGSRGLACPIEMRHADGKLLVQSWGEEGDEVFVPDEGYINS